MGSLLLYIMSGAYGVGFFNCYFCSLGGLYAFMALLGMRCEVLYLCGSSFQILKATLIWASLLYLDLFYLKRAPINTITLHLCFQRCSNGGPDISLIEQSSRGTVGPSPIRRYQAEDIPTVCYHQLVLLALACSPHYIPRCPLLSRAQHFNRRQAVGVGALLLTRRTPLGWLGLVITTGSSQTNTPFTHFAASCRNNFSTLISSPISYVEVRLRLVVRALAQPGTAAESLSEPSLPLRTPRQRTEHQGFVLLSDYQ